MVCAKPGFSSGKSWQLKFPLVARMSWRGLGHELYVTIPSTQGGFLSSLLVLSYSMTQKRPLLTAFLSYTLVLSDSLITQLLYT
jgi:hypothetical protein